jgi:hypothetical protein
MNHFDYNNGNYFIDFDTGQITFMISIILVSVGICLTWPVSGETEWAGYRSETRLDHPMLNTLPLFIQANFLENIIDAFEVMGNNGEEPECDEETISRISDFSMRFSRVKNLFSMRSEIFSLFVHQKPPY